MRLKLPPPILLILLVLWGGSIMYGGVNIANSYFEHVWIGVPGSCAAVLFLFLFFERYKIPFRNVFTRIGQLTLFILCMHLIDLNGLHMGRYVKMFVEDMSLPKILIPGILGLLYPVYMLICYEILKRIPLTKKVYHL